MPASKPPPSARARRLAAELRRLREASGLTGEEVASILTWSASKVSRIETSRSAITAGDLRSLLDLYQVAGSLRDRLAELCRTAQQRGWWDAFGDTLGYGYSTFLALESDAETERLYAQLLVPGILQTPRYAEEIIRAGNLAPPPGEITRKVQARMARKQLITKENPLDLSIILDESALRRQVGGRDVMAEQISYLIEITKRPKISIQIIPFEAGAHIAMAGPYVLLSFPGSTVSFAVYLENMTSELFIENEAEAYQYSLAFDRLREQALDQEESIRFMTQMTRG